MENENYSQYNEQDHILRHVPQAFEADVKGRFLDIGGWHPTDKSNTRALWERGWEGIIIEPAPVPFEALLRGYGKDPRIKLICAAVGVEAGLAQIHASCDLVSTTDEATFKKWDKQQGGICEYYGTFLTPQITPSQIFHQFGGFDFISIDTEGTSVDIFHAILATGARPRCMCLEYDDRLSEALVAASDAGYRAVHTNGTNVVLAR